MSILFEPTRIKNLILRNRFVRSATADGRADESGYVTEEQICFFEELAAGGVGLIITGLAYVNTSARISPSQNSLADDGSIPGLRKLTATVHDHGAKIAAQLCHAGREAMIFFRDRDERSVVAPSVVPNDPYCSYKYRTVREDEIWDIVRAFGDAARRAREAGFDAVQLHGAHGYLLSQFLSPHSNRRDDKWGGALENRLRIHQEIYRDIKMKVDDDFPVLIKFGVEDGFSGGLEFTEGQIAARHLAEWGFNALEISQGLRGEGFVGTAVRTKIDTLGREGYFRDWCRGVKSLVAVPVMTVGGLRTLELMEEIIDQGDADFVSLSRPFIREPGIVNRWMSGDRRRAECISCNKCMKSKTECVELKSQETQGAVDNT